MKVQDLIDLLKTFPKESEVFVNRIGVTGATITQGRVRPANGNSQLNNIFVPVASAAKHRESVVELTCLEELSTGDAVESTIFDGP